MGLVVSARSEQVSLHQAEQLITTLSTVQVRVLSSFLTKEI
jgi:hypothetical protein